MGSAECAAGATGGTQAREARAAIRPLSAATGHGGRWALGGAVARDMRLLHGHRSCDTAWATPTTWPQQPATRPGQGLLYGHCSHLGVPVCVGWACWLGHLGEVGALYTWLSSDSVFDPI